MKGAAFPVLFRIASKVDIDPIIDYLKPLNWDKLSKEDKDVHTSKMISMLLPQLGTLSNEVIPLIASLKGISNSEAEKYEFTYEELESLFTKEVFDFFTSALRKKVGQT